MSTIRTANKRHKRAHAAPHSHNKPAATAPVEAAEPVKAAL